LDQAQQQHKRGLCRFTTGIVGKFPVSFISKESLTRRRVSPSLKLLDNPGPTTKEKRGCGIATRNRRLAAIHALARLIGLHAPELVEWCGQVCAVPFEKSPRSLVTYPEKVEMDAVLAAPDLSTWQGRRDHALLLFLYNTGARADEAAQARIEDLNGALEQGQA
jgi:integrase